jgi:hypothetical protein
VKRLETKNGTMYTDFSKENIAAALAALNTTNNTFAILEKDDDSIIQVANNGKQGFYVGIQDIKAKNQYDKISTEIKDVVGFFVDFERNKDIVVPQKWTKTKIPTTHRVKALRKLSHIGTGIVLIAAFLYLFFNNNFDIIPLTKYMMLRGFWLMVPAALIDVINFISLLKRGSIDDVAMRGFIVIVCAVAFTVLMIIM